MTWRLWRHYTEITQDLTLTTNFISRSHYMTEELLVHARINHQLSLYLSFPDLPTSKYSLRNTGKRGLEAIHGIFRGGSSSLPITGANLSFQESLSRMNKTLQVHEDEHILKHIEGNTIFATKKKRLTSALHSNEKQSTEAIEAYEKPSLYSLFLKQLVEASQQGDEDSKKAISSLAPEMAASLKSAKKWDSPLLLLTHLMTRFQLCLTIYNHQHQ